MTKKGLGSGLLSLIPNRQVEDVDEEMEAWEEGAGEDEVVGKASGTSRGATKGVGRRVRVTADDEASGEAEVGAAAVEEPAEAEVVRDELPLEEGEELPVPAKPLVTPLTIDVDDEPDDAVLLEDEQEDVVAEAPATSEAVTAAAVSQRSRVAVSKNVSELPDAMGAESEQSSTESASQQKRRREVAADRWDRHESEVYHVPLAHININPSQPRRKFDQAEMDELTSSIEQHGILQPLVVRRRPEEGDYELVAGERRLRAAKALEWKKVPVVIRRGVASGAAQLELALIENIQRQDLNPVEEALAYRQLNEEYGMTHEEIGERVGRSRVGITNSIRILQLPEEIRKGLSDNKITPGHARAILMIPDEEKQIRFYRHLVEEGLTVRKAETRARRIQRSLEIENPMRQKRLGRSTYELKYSGRLEDRYGYDARLKFNELKNRFEVLFRCYSKEDANELVGRLLGTVELPSKDTDRDVIDDE